MSTFVIDWTPFDKLPESTCTCVSGHTFRSHARTVMGPKPSLVSRRPCPACGTIALRRAASDPETMTLKGKP
jgi:hypothetical protein